LDILSKGFFLFGIQVKWRDLPLQTQGGEQMKTGLILYVIGNECDQNLENIIQAGRKKYAADRVEIVSKNTGHCDIDYAWWALAARGVHRVVCSIVEISDNGSARFSGNNMRLCG